jgi:WD40-like Beta Propeller Repeat
MPGLRKVLERSSLVACGALGLALSQCSGKEFSYGASSGATSVEGGADSRAGAGGGPAAGGGGGGGGGGDAEVVGGAGAGGVSDGGKGGSSPGTCDCRPGRYCLDGSTDCLECSDPSRLAFGEPVRLATVSDNGAGSRFPRIGRTSSDLLYRFEGVGLRYTEDSSTSAGTDLAATDPSDSAPFLLRAPVQNFSVVGASQLDFSFDRTVMNVRTLRVGSWSQGLLSSALAPPPLNSGAGDFSMAIALEAAPGVSRAFWMTNRESVPAGAPKPRLVTAQLGTDLTAADVALRLSVGTNESCPPLDVSQLPAESEPIDGDLTPWVSSDGTLLVFSTTRLGSGCAPGTQKRDIYTALLQASSGQPPEPALPMKNVNSSEDDVDPAFSADLCDLYFASNRDGKFAVYRAHRN